jgi:hypothetical protein
MRKPLMIGMVAAVLAVGGAAIVANATATPNDRPRTATSSSVTAPPSTISQADAERIAVNAVPGGHVTEADLQTVGGRSAWDVDISTATGQHEVMVDAANGQILSIDRPNGDSSEPGPSSPATPAPASPTCDDGPGHDVADDHCGH